MSTSEEIYVSVGMLSVGSLVPRILITGYLEADGAVTLLSVRIDFEAGW